MDILKTTQIGRDAEYATKWEGAPYPAPVKLVIGDGNPATTHATRAPLTDVVHRIAEFNLYGLPDRVTDPATGIETVTYLVILPATFAGIVRELGVIHADGKMHRYTPFALETNGFSKGLGYSQNIYVASLVTDEEPGMATIRFEPLDAALIAERIIEHTRIIRTEIIREIFCGGLQSPPFGEEYDCDAALNLTPTDVVGILAPAF